MSTVIASRKLVRDAAMEFNRLSPEQLAEKLKGVPTRNLAVLRDAAREYGALGVILPQDVTLIAGAITTEINRRWQ